MLRAIWRTEVDCCSRAAVTWSWTAPTVWVMVSALPPDWCARSLTSLATTANPLPASPARTASIVVFRASRLVCAATPWITSAAAMICPLEVSNARIRSKVSLTPARRPTTGGQRRRW